jgi:hypothetical protein
MTGLLMLGCGDEDLAGPQAGSIEVTLMMSGSTLDADGCLVSIDDGAGHVLLDGERVTTSGLSPDIHTVTLSEVAFNCSLQGETTRTVTVISNETATVDFDLDCPAPGNIELITRTGGSLIDPDGYTVTLDDGLDRDVGVSDTVTLKDLAVGEHVVGLTGIADECSVIGENPRSAVVEEGETTRVDISVVCPPFDDHIAFASYRDPKPDGTLDLWVMKSDGSNPVKLTDHPGPDSHPSWSPDGTLIAFQAYRNRDQDIWVMDADGSNPVNLTSDFSRDASAPAWSPDGTRIAFTSWEDIYVMNSDGTDVQALIDAPYGEYTPSWTADCTKIVYCAHRWSNFDIYVYVVP